MAQQIQFIYLTQSDYDNLTPQTSKIYFTSDTKRIYKGSDLYAATSFDQLNFNSIEASNITVDGDPVSVEGHTHAMSEIEGLASGISGIESSISTLESSVSSMATTMSGISEMGISKQSATFQTLIVTGEVTMSLSSVDFQNINASSLTVDGSAVSLEGHSHSASEISGLDAVISAATSSFATSEHTHDISDITSLATIVSGITSSSIEKENGQFVNLNATNLSVSQLTVDATVVSANSMTVGGSNVSVEGHTHVISEITDLDMTALAGITSSTIDKDSGNFVTLSASTATFETMTVSGSATFDITNLVADAITVADLNLTGTLSISSTAISAMTVTDMSVTGTLTLNSKSIATQEYVQLMISQAIGQILASAY